MKSRCRKYIQWELFALLTLLLAGKCAVWHMQFFADKAVPILGCLTASMLLASGIFLSKRRPWWTLLLLAATNIWLFANFAYERAWGQVLTADMIRMAGNLRGFENSLLTYFHRDMLLWMFLPDLVWLAALFLWREPQRRAWSAFVSVLLAFFWLIPVQQRDYYNRVFERRSGYNTHTGLAHWWHIHQPSFSLFAWPRDAAYDAFMFQVPQDWTRAYLYEYGVIHFGPALWAYDARYRRLERSARTEVVELTPEQQDLMARLTGPEPDFRPSRSLVFILVESLESWAIDYPLGEGYVMPNLHDLIHSRAVWYAPQMYCQLAYGGSSDGQLMAITGLLPVQQGVSVALYGDQPFPNYAHFYPHSITLNPSPGTWKQDIVNPNYGILQLEESDSIRDDAGIFRRLNTIDLSEPTFVLAITVSSHVPFAKADEIDLSLDPDMPATMAKYLKCLHYFDEQLGSFLARMDADSTVANTDIVITGDHTIFYSQDWAQMQQYAASKGITCLGDGPNMLPLVLYSPTLTEPVTCEEPTFQMDIYPTVLHLIGCNAPAWRGVGLDLLGDEPRTIGLEVARPLCDKLIRSQYFTP